MLWMAAGLATSFFGNLMKEKVKAAANDAQSAVDNANTYAQNTTNRANADAANAVRVANNGFAAAQAALSNLTRHIGNQQKLSAGGKAEDAVTTNLLRLQDQVVRGSLDTQLRSAEQLGAVRAVAAASGIGGTTAKMLQNTMQLTAARAQTTANENAKYQTYDMLQQRAGLVSNKIMSLDEGQTFASVDYNLNIAPLVQSPIRASQYQGSSLGSVLFNTAVSNLGTLATIFGGGLSAASGSVGSTSGYASSSILSGPNSMTSGLGSLGGISSGFFSAESGSKVANFQLS